MPQQLAVPPIWRCLSEYGSSPGDPPAILRQATGPRLVGQPSALDDHGGRPSAKLLDDRREAGPAPMMQSSVSISAPGGIELPSTSMA